MTDWWTWGPVTGAIVRRVPTTLVNVSARGCLLETTCRLEPGTIGLLEVEAGDRSHTEAIRVCHAIERVGSSAQFRAGTEFLVLDAAMAPSLRHQAARLESWQSSSRLVRAGENSGRHRTRANVVQGSGGAAGGENTGNGTEF